MEQFKPSEEVPSAIEAVDDTRETKNQEKRPRKLGRLKAAIAGLGAMMGAEAMAPTSAEAAPQKGKVQRVEAPPTEQGLSLDQEKTKQSLIDIMADFENPQNGLDQYRLSGASLENFRVIRISDRQQAIFKKETAIKYILKNNEYREQIKTIEDATLTDVEKNAKIAQIIKARKDYFIGQLRLAFP